MKECINSPPKETTIETYHHCGGCGMIDMRKPKITFARWMVTFVPRAFVIGVATMCLMWVIIEIIKFMITSVIAASPLGVIP